MKFICYDFEVTAYDWLVDLKDTETGEHTTIHNDAAALLPLIKPENLYVGFNTKNYDYHIMRGIADGLDNAELKQLNDWIIAGGNSGWDFPLLDRCTYRFNNVDLRDDMLPTLSLKAIEGHLGMDIRESSIPFDINRPLTQEEVEEMTVYCRHDVDATHELMKVRWGYLTTKMNLGKRVGLSPAKALSMSNAKLTATLLKANRVDRTDGRDYVYPPHLDLEAIPQEVLAFFDTIHDKTIPEDKLFETSLEITLGGMPCKYAWGGVHGSLTKYHEKATETRVIQNRDVSSLYPSLIELYGYLSRNVPDPELFYSLRRERLEAKHRGDTQTAKDLKLPLNTVSGAQESRFNALYDPLPTRSLRISGQLFLTVLTMRLLRNCPTIKLLNLNTDGLMYSIDKSDADTADRIAHEWEQETGFELELDEIQEVWIKDVNNLFLVKTNGKPKAVGGYLGYGITEKGAWNINNSMPVVKKALARHFLEGIPVRQAVLEDDDIHDFQLIAKAGDKYSKAYQNIDGVPQDIQKVNRVYATSDTRYGTLYKVKTADGSVAKIESLPDHCIIDNDNHLTIGDIDKNFYIEVAEKRLADFIGKENEVAKAAESKPVPTTGNVYKRLLTARAMFLQAGVSKSGKHMELRYKYFELDDIVPIAMECFVSTGLIPVVSFTEETATMDIVNVDAPEEKVTFTCPVRYPLENRAVNPVQALGSAQTYLRRYLYMLALDICEPDTIEPTTRKVTEPQTPAEPGKPAPPPTPAKREEIAEELAAPEGAASDLQREQLKAGLKKLRAKDPASEEWIMQVLTATNNLTALSKEDAEKLMQGIADKLTA